MRHVLSKAERTAKLNTLMEAEGYEDFEAFLQDAATDGISPSICIRPGCDHVAEMEPDQDRGWCEGCGRNTQVSALVLAEVL